MLERVLVVDDSESDLLYTQIVLQRSGQVAEVVTAESAQEALALLRDGGTHFDAILLDINMPGMNGFAFLEAYERLDPARADAVVVMLTSSPDPQDRRRAFSFTSVRDYVVKPIDAAGVERVVVAVERIRVDRG